MLKKMRKKGKKEENERKLEKKLKKSSKENEKCKVKRTNKADVILMTFFFFSFSFFCFFKETSETLLGLPKWKFPLGKGQNHNHAGKKSGK